MNTSELARYWKSVVDTIQDGVMIVDTQGNIISVNRAFCEITGYSHEEIIGSRCTTLNCTSCEIARVSGENCHWCVMFEKGHLKKQRCSIIRKDQQIVQILKNASVLRNEAGEVTGAVETMTDVTDLVNKEVQIERFRRELHAEDRFFGMIGISAGMQRLFQLITNAAHSDAPVIIYGESGTGKEMVARAIHEAGERRGKPYVKVNCAALNESLLESELFGHVKGAYTGAHRSREGRFEAAAGGDIFLDEIGDLPLSTQVKLLRVLEEKVVERVGDNLPIPVNVRIISATNRDLRQLIDQGTYRQDFYYRINVIPIHVPPLRERREDIPLLARSFFNRLVLKSAKEIEGITNSAMEAMVTYGWPGNVRELKSAFEFAFVSCPGGMIDIPHLPPQLSGAAQGTADRLQSLGNIEDMKKRRLIEALDRAAGNRSQAAQLLGLSRTGLWKQMKRFGIVS